MRDGMAERGGVHFQAFVISEKSTKSIQYPTFMIQYFTDYLLMTFRLSKSYYKKKSKKIPS